MLICNVWRSPINYRLRLHLILSDFGADVDMQIEMKCLLRAALSCRLALLAAFAFNLAAFPGKTASAETFLGSNVDSRIVLAFQVNTEAAQTWLPEGWQVAPIEQGPLSGANLFVVLVDRHLSRDADDNPTTPPSFGVAALVNPASRPGTAESRFYVTRIYATAAGYDPYGNAMGARINRRTIQDASETSAPVRTEKWVVGPDHGGEIVFELSYNTGAPSWSEGELTPYSSAKPDFYRIYRYEQLSELVMSVPGGKELAGEAKFTTTISEMGPMFNGEEMLVGIVAIPVYMRRVFLP